MASPGELVLDATRAANRRLRQSRALRQAGITTYRTALSMWRVLPGPRLCLNGYPKSGTHLLSDAAALLPKMMYSGRHFAMAEFVVDPALRHREAFPDEQPVFDEEALRRFLRRCAPGMFVTAHARCRPELQSAMADLGMRHVLLVRDPRDVVLSASRFVVRQTQHHHHEHLGGIADADERVLRIIEGFEGIPGVPDRASIGAGMQGFLPWLDDPATTVLRYEDLVGSRGGGDDERMIESLRRLAEVAERDLDVDGLRRLADRMYSEGSYTFSRGTTGGWRESFTDAHHEAFERVAGDVRERLGYPRA